MYRAFELRLVAFGSAVMRRRRSFLAFGGSRAPQAATGITGICHGTTWERNGLLTRGFLLRDRCHAYIQAIQEPEFSQARIAPN